MKSSLRDVFGSRLHEVLREIGVLWLVFSTLDRLIADKLTLSWFLLNAVFALAAWTMGIYIEWRTDEDRSDVVRHDHAGDG